MAYLVVYQRADGTNSVEPCADLDAAIGAAERLRNDAAIERPRIFEASEIQYDFQPYYRVHVVGGSSTASVSDTSAAASHSPAASSGTAASYGTEPTASAATEPVATDLPPPPSVEPSWTANAGSRSRSGGLFSDFKTDAPDAGDASVVDTAVTTESSPVAEVAADAGVTADAGVVASEVETAPEEVDFAPTHGEFGAPAVADTPEVVVPDGPETIEIYDDEYELDPTGAVDTGAAQAVNTGIDTDLAANALGDTGLKPEESAPTQKTGLFEKFVSSLEGGSGAAAGAAEEAVEDIGDGGASRRGLFGR